MEEKRSSLPLRKVAVVGAGVAGLAAASSLHEAGVDFVLFEKEAHIGGHAYTKTVPNGDGKGGSVDVDCGFMVFNNVTYSNMIEWFQKYEVEIEPTNMSLGISVKDGWLEWASEGLSALFGQKSNLVNPEFYLMLRDLARFKADAEKFLSEIETSSAFRYIGMKKTMQNFLDEFNYSTYFRDYYLLPVCAAVWSCPTNTARDFPAYFILNFMKNHHMLQILDRPVWNTIAARSQKGYVQKVIAGFKDKIRANTEIKSIVRCVLTDDDEYSLTSQNFYWRLTDSNGKQYAFEKILFACHAPEILEMLGSFVTEEQRDYLSVFEYENNDIWLHRDPKLLPKRQSVWSSWNFLGDANGKVCVSYWLNKLQNLPVSDPENPIVVTLNPPAGKYPAADKVVERFVLAHPVPSVASAEAQFKNAEMQGINGLYFSGAWQFFGFHEDGCKSGLLAAKALLGAEPRALNVSSRLEFSLFQSFAKARVMDFMKAFLTKGRLQITEIGGDSYVFGDGVGPRANIIVRHPGFYTSILLRFDLGIADAYIDGHFDVRDLNDFLSVLIVNRDTYRKKNGGKIGYLFTALGAVAASTFNHRFFNRNTPEQAQRNISAHYDLSNDLFKLFLDKSMTYSSGIYRNPTDSLLQAQMNKICNLISKARVRSTDRVLEIGFGWGSLSITLAKMIGCHVTGITLSKEQKAYAEELVKKEGLEHLIDYQLVDYRRFQPKDGPFDRILSCEMLEAVGHEFLGEYFANVQRLMKPDGIAVIQVITMPDSYYDEYRNTVDFIQEYIFPGAICPALTDILVAVKSRTDLVLEETENIGFDYARTLEEWHDRFMARKEEILALPGRFDERFIRSYQYYFKYCQAGFQMRVINDLQLVFSQPGNSNLALKLPVTPPSTFPPPSRMSAEMSNIVG